MKVWRWSYSRYIANVCFIISNSVYGPDAEIPCVCMFAIIVITFGCVAYFVPCSALHQHTYRQWPTAINSDPDTVIGLIFYVVLPSACLSNQFCISIIYDKLKSRAGNSLICSFRSNQMSGCERFAKIAQDKWAIVSESLRSFMTNERSWAIRSGRSW